MYSISFKILATMAIVLATIMTSSQVHAMPTGVQPPTPEGAAEESEVTPRGLPVLAGFVHDFNATHHTDELHPGNSESKNEKTVIKRDLPILAAFVHDFNATRTTDGLAGHDNVNTKDNGG
ncbi:hypothetical protein BDN70DRAFT_897852 [Pholiota conissans]|uniref:Secreted protein n=1 Tax=Pholiota conissans TaxID=109636 RepID=A0A9P6CX18_9AGAR|nr:hypothetical protein BDN70DRAFT_897852 [Pholiota conissans]